MSKRRIRRDLHKRVASAGYQQIAGDLEVRGRILGPTVTNLASGVGALSAITTTPVQLAAPTAQGTMRSIALNWSRQYTLSNLSHYELQVSDNDQDWYSLDLDGSGWGIELNGDTDVKAEYFTHPNIPLVQDGSDLVGKKLYYRVRQVTLAGVRSAWSESCNATTKPVEDLVLTDSRNRYIEISSHKGIYADDRQGHVIHDIPDAPILTGMVYGGHVLWKEASNYLGYHSDTFNDNAANFSELSVAGNVDISAYIGGNTNVKGALTLVQLTTGLASAKIAIGTKATLIAFYGLTYNPTPVSTGYNWMKKIFCRCTHTMGSSQWDNVQSSHALVPVVYNGTTPYLSWWHYLNFEDMVAVNGVYTATTVWWLLGLVI